MEEHLRPTNGVIILNQDEEEEKVEHVERKILLI